MPSPNDMPPRGSASDSRLWWGTLITCALILCAPLLVTDLPPLGDYLNHLARMFVITQIGSDPILARMYSVTWGVVPNLAMDLVVPPLSHVMPLTVAGRLFVALALLLPVAGVLALHRATFGVRSPWPLATLLVAYNGLFFWGFLNFVTGMGLALLGVALWQREPVRGGTMHLLAMTVLALVLFFCHLEALALMGVTIGCIELTRVKARYQQGGPVAIIWRAAVIAAPFIVPALLFLFAAPLGDGIVGKPLSLQIKEYYWAVHNAWRDGKLTGLGIPFASDSPLLDGLAAALTALVFARQIWRYGCRIAPGPLMAAGLLMALYPFVPSVWLTAANLDARLPLFAVLLLLAGIAPNGPVGRPAMAGAAVLLVLLIARACIVASVWAGGNADIAECRRVMATLTPAERVMVVSGDPADSASRPLVQRLLLDPWPGSLAPLLTLDRRAFWPGLFTSRTLQPVHVIPPFLDIAVEQAVLPTVPSLTEPTTRDLMLNPYLRDWRARFDDVLILQPGHGPGRQEPVPGVLRPRMITETCSLYTIVR